MFTVVNVHDSGESMLCEEHAFAYTGLREGDHRPGVKGRILKGRILKGRSPKWRIRPQKR